MPIVWPMDCQKDKELLDEEKIQGQGIYPKRLRRPMVAKAANGGNHHNVPCRGRKKGFNLLIGPQLKGGEDESIKMRHLW